MTHVFIVRSCPFLTTEVSALIPVTTVVLFIFVMSTLLKTSFTDPGIIPRATADEAMYIEKQISKFDLSRCYFEIYLTFPDENALHYCY